MSLNSELRAVLRSVHSPSHGTLTERLSVPGYGSGVAADTGSGIQGATIDLWMTPSQCASWGRRTVTITVY